MHRDEVKIFRGNVETHLMRLEQATQVTGAPPAATVFGHSLDHPTPDALPYESRKNHPSPWSYVFSPFAFGCLAATSAFLAILEVTDGWSTMSPARLKVFGGSAVFFLLATLISALSNDSRRR